MHGNLQNTVYMNLRRQEIERQSQRAYRSHQYAESLRADQRNKPIYAPVLASIGKLLISMGVRLVKRHSREMANVRDTMEVLAVTVQGAPPKTADTNSY